MVSVSGEDQPDKNMGSALKSIAKGNKPWKGPSGFGFRGFMEPRNGKYSWTIVARKSASGEPTLELYHSVRSGRKKFTRRIKIRYGDKQS